MTDPLLCYLLKSSSLFLTEGYWSLIYFSGILYVFY
jgi:hypothetical protein